MNIDPLLTRKEAAQELTISVRTLEAMAVRGDGPTMTKIGRLCRYRLSHLREYIDSRSRRHTHDTPTGEVR